MAGALREALEDFVARLGRSDVARRMIADWRRRILVEAEDTGSRLVIVSTGRGPGPVEEPTGDEEMRISAPEETLLSIFRGEIDPMAEYLAGRLRYRGTQADEVRLDAVVNAMWRQG